jgi:hypothetical protein
VSCECCGDAFVDEVALLVIADALETYRGALLEKGEADRAAWADAETQTAVALAAATGGQG